MEEHKYPNKNSLIVYRRRLNLPQQVVARLLRHADYRRLSAYENGRSLPPLLTALRLEIIYRVPVAFLFPDLYEALRTEIRAEEARLPIQQELPLTYRNHDEHSR